MNTNYRKKQRKVRENYILQIRPNQAFQLTRNQTIFLFTFHFTWNF